MSDSTSKLQFVSTETGEIFNEQGAGRVETPMSKTGFPDATLDYCAGTIKCDAALELLQEIFGSDGWEEQARGTQFYHKQSKRGNITLLWDGITDGMGTRFELSGQGCRELEGREGFEGWQIVLARLLEMHCKFTRVDVALDDRAGLLSLPIIKEKIETKEVATHYRTARGVWECSLADFEQDGEQVQPSSETLYFGRRDGLSMIRFYDWQAKHGGNEQFIRCELELHKRMAHRMAEKLGCGADVGRMCAQVIAGKLLFKEAGEEKQKTRWQTCDWWEKFLGAVEGVKLSVRPVAATLNRKLQWVQKYVAPTLALLEEQADEPGLVAQVVAAGMARIKRTSMEYKRVCSLGWKQKFRNFMEDGDPFADEHEERRARLLFEYRVSAALSAKMT